MLSAYRSLLRAIGRFPISELRPKMRFNAREIFDLHRDGTELPAGFLEGIKEDAKFLADLSQVSPELLVQLYQPFSETVRKSQIVSQS